MRATLLLLGFVAACSGAPPRTTPPLDGRARAEVETPATGYIVAAGERIPVAAPVVLWTDPGGYDAYSTDYAFGAPSSGREVPEPGSLRYEPGRRTKGSDPVQLVRAGSTDLAELQAAIDLFVLHYDACGTSRQCFRILQDVRGLSVHFMIDVDGTIYQTLDLRERAWHAGTANTRSIGVEIAQIGAAAAHDASAVEALERWYRTSGGRTEVVLPASVHPESVRSPGPYFAARPGRIEGALQGTPLVQYDLTPAQYDSLVALTVALCRTFPRIRPDAPRTPGNAVIPTALSEGELATFSGILGHYHVTRQKIDPGPAFDWERYLARVRGDLATP